MNETLRKKMAADVGLLAQLIFLKDLSDLCVLDESQAKLAFSIWANSAYRVSTRYANSPPAEILMKLGDVDARSKAWVEEMVGLNDDNL